MRSKVAQKGVTLAASASPRAARRGMELGGGAMGELAEGAMTDKLSWGSGGTASGRDRQGRGHWRGNSRSGRAWQGEEREQRDFSRGGQGGGQRSEVRVREVGGKAEGAAGARDGVLDVAPPTQSTQSHVTQGRAPRGIALGTRAGRVGMLRRRLGHPEARRATPTRRVWR
jgi:hypothetical protein